MKTLPGLCSSVSRHQMNVSKRMVEDLQLTIEFQPHPPLHHWLLFCVWPLDPMIMQSLVTMEHK